MTVRHGNIALHSSIGVNSLSALSYILDLGWVDMLHLLHLQRDHRKKDIKAGKQKYLFVLLYLYKSKCR